jgi:hypothetical protein
VTIECFTSYVVQRGNVTAGTLSTAYLIDISTLLIRSMVLVKIFNLVINEDWAPSLHPR